MRPVGGKCMLPCAREMAACMAACKDSQVKNICMMGCKTTMDDCKEDCQACIEPCTLEKEQCIQAVTEGNFDSNEDKLADRRDCVLDFKECKGGLECNTDPCTEICASEAKACRTEVEGGNFDTRKDKLVALKDCTMGLKECLQDLECRFKPV